MTKVYIIGTGLAGLSSAIHALEVGFEVQVYEAAGHAGGRCRSFYDPRIDRTIDNGNHLIIGAYRETFAYLNKIGSQDRLKRPDDPSFKVYDLATSQQFCFDPFSKPQWKWLFDRNRRFPQTRWFDYLALLRFGRHQAMKSVSEAYGPDKPLFRSFIEPLCLGTLNTEPSRASAELLAEVLRRLIAEGPDGFIPYFAEKSLADVLIDPAFMKIKDKGGLVDFHTPVRGLEQSGQKISAIDLGDRIVQLGTADKVILALPPSQTAKLLQQEKFALTSNPILNIHFAATAEGRANTMMGILGGISQWVFLQNDILSVTISNPSLEILAMEEKDLVGKVWGGNFKGLEYRFFQGSPLSDDH